MDLSGELFSILLVILCVYIPINILVSFVSLDRLVQTYGDWRGLQLHDNLDRGLIFFIGIVATMAIAWIVE